MIETFEDRVMLSAVAADFDHDHSHDGGLCLIPLAQEETTVSTAADPEGAPPFPLSETFQLHSLPGANLVIYLDFDGHTTSGTRWNTDSNGGADIDSPAFSIDFDTGFNAIELEYIQRIWQRVAEDFAPFNVDVTTEDPGLEALRRSGPGDSRWGIRSIQTDDQSWLIDDVGFAVGGIAYLGSFQWGSDTPVFTFNGSDSTSLFSEMAAADTHSHEVGHSLGLSHDGRTSPSEVYYRGHGFGPTGWAPIMGAGFGQQLSQWSKGEYPNADQTQDDLAIITDPSLNGAGWGWSGLSYQLDDHGNLNGTATALSVFGTSLFESGLIEQNTDIDVFSFDAITGSYTFNINPWERGANLDILAEIYDSAGRLVASSNPFSALDASITTLLTTGRYFLHIRGTGKLRVGSDYGYSNYGSLGRYTIDGVLDFAEDPYEENDTLPTAADPRANGGLWEQTWLSAIAGPGLANDEDWFAIDVTPGFLRVIAELDYDFADGDIDLGLWDADGRELAWSEDQDDDERIVFDLSEAGRYYLRVYSYFPYLATTYDLRWDDVAKNATAQPTVTVAVSPAAVDENGTPNLVYTFTRTGNLAEPLTVDFNVGGTSAFGSDYTQTGAASFDATTGTVRFAEGSATATVTINPTGDAVIEPDETVLLTLAASSGYNIGPTSSATGRLLDDDAPRLTIANVSTAEGQAGTKTLTFTVTLDKAFAGGFTIDYATMNGTATAGSDYTAASGTLTFTGTAGETRTISIAIIGDTAFEPDETFELVLSDLSSPGVRLMSSQATGTILDDDAPAAPTGVQASDTRTDQVRVTWTAAVGAVSYEVWRNTSNVLPTGPLATDVTGTEYVDATAVPGVQYFYWVRAVNSFGNSDFSVSDAGGVLPVVTVSVSPGAVLEDGLAAVVYTFRRTGDTSQALTVNFTVNGAAAPGADYALTDAASFSGTTGTVVFAAGSATAVIGLRTVADAEVERNETAVLTVAAGTGYAIVGPAAATALIANDDRLGLVTGPAAGAEPLVRIFDPTGSHVRIQFYAYGLDFAGGVRVAVGDVNGDGVADVVVAPAAGAGAVRIFDGLSGVHLRSFFAFPGNPGFAGGITLAVADVNRDGAADILLSVAGGAGPSVRVVDGRSGAELSRFWAFAENPAFTGGVNLAAGDVDGDGDIEVVAAIAGGAGPAVRVLDPLTGAVVSKFWAFADNTAFTGGVSLAVGDVDGDQDDDVIVTPARGAGPLVRVLDGLSGLMGSRFWAFDPQFTGGVNLGVTDFHNSDAADVILAAPASGLPAVVRTFNVVGWPLRSVQAYPAGFTAGAFVAGQTYPTAAMPAGGSSSTGGLSTMGGISMTNGAIDLPRRDFVVVRSVIPEPPAPPTTEAESENTTGSEDRREEPTAPSPAARREGTEGLDGLFADGLAEELLAV